MSRGIALILVFSALLIAWPDLDLFLLPEDGGTGESTTSSLAGWTLDGFLPGGMAAAAEVVIETTRFTIDKETGITTYEDGLFRAGNITLFAARLELDKSRQYLKAEGFIRVETPTVSGSASSALYDAVKGVAVLRDANLYVPERGLYLRGEEVTLKAEGVFSLKEWSFTTCQPDVPAGWRLSSSELTLEELGMAVAWNPVLSIGPVPVFWLPVMAWPVVTERRSGFLFPEISEDGSSLKRLDLGLRIKTPVFLNLGLEHDLTINPEFIEKRAPALGLEYNYAFRSGQVGSLSAFGLKENNARDPAQENDFLPPGEAALRDPEPGRYLLDYRHNELFGEGARLTLAYHHSSDGQVRREYERVGEYRPYRTYQATLTHQGEWTGLGFTFEQNADFLQESIYADGESTTDMELRPQRLPHLFAGAGGQFLGGWGTGLELGASLTRFVAPGDVSGRMTVGTPELSWPLALGGSVELRPTLKRHYVAYRQLARRASDGSEIELDDQSFSQGEGNLELRAAFGKVFPPKKDQGRSYKHLIVPRLILNGVEDVPQPYADKVLRTRVARELITFRLDNQVLRVSTAEKTGDLAGEYFRFNIIQRYNRLREADAEPLTGPVLEGDQETEAGEPLLPLILETAVSGTASSFSASLHYHHQREEVTRSALGYNLNLSKHSRLGLAYAFNEFTYRTPEDELVSEGESFTFGGETPLSDRISMGFEGRLNLKDDPPPLDRRLDQGLAFMEYHPGCYRARLSYEEIVGSTLENGEENFFVQRRIWLTFNLRGVGGGSDSPITARREEPSGGGRVAGSGAAGRSQTAGQCAG